MKHHCRLSLFSKLKVMQADSLVLEAYYTRHLRQGLVKTLEFCYAAPVGHFEAVDIFIGKKHIEFGY